MERLRGSIDHSPVSPSRIPISSFLFVLAQVNICLTKTYLLGRRAVDIAAVLDISFNATHLLILLPDLKCVCVSSSHLVSSFLKESAGDGLSSKCVEPGTATASFSDHLKMSCGSLSSHQTPVLRLLQGAMQAGEEMVEEEVQLHLQQYQHRRFFTSYPQETNFQLLRRMQSQCHFRQLRMAEMDRSCAVEQLESCVTHVSESETRGIVHREDPATAAATGPMRSLAAAGSNERRNRKRQRPASASKSAEEAESQRMTHIAVERNRRHLMNVHLATLRALMPPSFVQRGDQASIIGGAIEFVKELEQHLLSLRAQKRFRESAFARSSSDDDDPCRATLPLLHDDFLISPQYTGYSQSQRRRRDGNGEEPHQEDWTGVDVEATLVQGHVNLKVAGRRQRGQLVRAIAAMEELRLSILHLNITSLGPSSILYSLNLKMEEECKLGTADEIATAVHQIFSYNSNC
ncbi:hypothetical protein C4D60_Mb11t19090 [Musa balbisiana]|uniref:BHLH domain-containing protein n=1 Tax=Musa balbisiana TaxID=52838 RepID=A0A4S8J564_MUSBA|nr:hypothetical protein C4D60_Mb11t19090 [Musa balbisiana]